jgi:hypothetical protein
MILKNIPNVGDLIKFRSMMDPCKYFYGMVLEIEKCKDEILSNTIYTNIYWSEDGCEELYINLNDIEIIA